MVAPGLGFRAVIVVVIISCVCLDVKNGLLKNFFWEKNWMGNFEDEERILMFWIKFLTYFLFSYVSAN